MITLENAARRFVDLLVPGHFDEARALLHPSCEYAYAGGLLRGDAIIHAFEESHARAEAELDRIEYLPGEVDSVDGDTVTVRVFDRLRAKGRTHTYVDRLAVSLVASASASASASPEASTWQVRRIEHLPIEEERLALDAFRRGR